MTSDEHGRRVPQAESVGEELEIWARVSYRVLIRTVESTLLAVPAFLFAAALFAAALNIWGSAAGLDVNTVGVWIVVGTSAVFVAPLFVLFIAAFHAAKVVPYER